VSKAVQIDTKARPVCILVDFAEWDAVLTTAEIKALASGVSPKYIRPESLVRHTPPIAEVRPKVEP
jgi:hypothetical protein